MLRRFPAGGPWPERQAPKARSSGASVNRQTFDPNRKTDGGNGIRRAKACQQSVVTATGDQRIAGACRIGQFEHNASVIVEATPEGGRETYFLEVDAAGFNKSGAAFELIERRCKRRSHFGLARERAQRRRRLVGIALNCKESLDQPANVARQLGAGTERG